jgi:hypothetical protein
LQWFAGLAFEGGLGRLRGRWDLLAGLHRAGEARSPDVNQFLIALHVGYALYQTEKIALFPLLGIAGGDVGVKLDPNDPALFADQIADDPKVFRARKNFGALLFSAGAEYKPVVWPSLQAGLLLSAQAGYAWQFAESSWLRDDAALPDLVGGPAADANGLYVRVGAGIFTF